MTMNHLPIALMVFLLISPLSFIRGDDSPCWSMNGRCQYTSEPCFEYKAGYCAGPTNRQCCVLGKDIQCWNRGGYCQNNSNRCSGRYLRGYCGGGLSRQCCV
ncbi:lysozyme 1-like [Saccostrea cucullata]|uniref:lysozyme 1-like n=1 Tax=Saccostrea cuccullata TaxID=36930 RepID=UPI002ED62404